MIGLLLAAALAAGDPAAPGSQDAAAQAQAPAPTAPAKKNARDPNKVICREEEVAGQRIPTRICMTRAEWDAQDERMRQFFQNQRDAGAIAAPSGPPATGIP